MSYTVSCGKKRLVRAVGAVMACVPKPWTPIMVIHATRAVLDVAHNWRNAVEIDMDEGPIYTHFLETYRRDPDVLIIPDEYDASEYLVDELVD